jgi:hypothetical protein
LTAIRCNEAGGATFHLSTADGGLDISTPRMGDVDFVTYRTDLSGSIACGPLASPVPVYLTSKEDPNAAGGTVVVAVEFLQK